MFSKALPVASAVLALTSSASAAVLKAREQLPTVPSVEVPGVITTPNVTILGNHSLVNVSETNVTIINTTIPGFEILKKKRSPLTITLPLSDIPIVGASNTSFLNITITAGGQGINIGGTPITNYTVNGQSVNADSSAVNATNGLGGRDACVYAIDGTFDAASDLVTQGTDADVFSDSCLCLGTIPGFIQSDARSVAIANSQGLANVTALLDVLVLSDPAVQNCTFPRHATPACQFNDPCSYTCLPGYVRIGDVCARADNDVVTCNSGFTAGADGSCVCEAPATIYNGVCYQQATNEAPSTTPATRRRRSLWF